MYCTGCGTEINSDLNYCNRCGSRVAKGSSGVAENLSQSVSYVGGFGLIGFIFAIAVMAKQDLPVVALVAISFFYLSALSIICFLMIRQVAALTDKRAGGRVEEQSVHEPYLRPLTTAQLPEPTEQPASVTEHTTRTLDKVPAPR